MDLWKPPPEVRAALERGRRKIARAKARNGQIPVQIKDLVKGEDLIEALIDRESLLDEQLAIIAAADIRTLDRADEDNESVILRDGKDAAWRLSPPESRLRLERNPGWPSDVPNPNAVRITRDTE